MNKLIFICLFSFTFLFPASTNNYNSIFYYAKSPKTNSLNGIHFLSENVSEIFYQPISKESVIKNDYYFSFSNQYDDQLKIFQFAYCINHNEYKNSSIGFINRIVDDIYNTSSAWNQYEFLIPEFNNIDYDQISVLDYKDYGFVFSYNRYLEKINLCLKIKPSYNSFDSDRAFGLDIDLLSYYKLADSGIDFIIGLNNLISYKRWNNNDIEKNEIEYFLSSNIKLNKINIFLQVDNIYNEKIAIEYDIKNSFYIRFGRDNNNYYTSGFGVFSNIIDVNYAYSNHNILGNNHQISLMFKMESIKYLDDKIDL